MTDRRTQLAELSAAMIAIDSTNSDLVPDGAGEAELAGYCADWLTPRGFDCRMIESKPGQVSVLAIGPQSGRQSGPPVMLNGHLDTVTLSTYDGDGLDPRVDEGRLYGRGSYDMKAGLAAMMVAADEAAGRGAPVVLALVADEEWGSAGTEAVIGYYREHPELRLPKFAIVCEPTDLQVVTTHRGWAAIEITFHGVASHGSRPDLGVDAIAKAGKFLGRVEELHAELTARPKHPMLGTGGLHASTVEGGGEVSSYPDRCTVVVERRTLPGESGATAVDELRAVLDELAADDPQFRYEIACTFERAALAEPADLPQLPGLLDSIRTHIGSEPVVRGEQFWTDAALLSDAGIPSVLFGPSGGGPHAAVEWVDLDSVEVVADVLIDVLG